MTEFRDRLLDFAFIQCGACFGNIELCILVALISGREFLPLSDFASSLVPLSGAGQGQPQLIMGLAALRFEFRRLS